jgi:hypothetical protein
LAADAAPDPMTLHPVAGQPRVVLLKPLITSPLIEVGEFSYYDDPSSRTSSKPEMFCTTMVLID